MIRPAGLALAVGLLAIAVWTAAEEPCACPTPPEPAWKGSVGAGLAITVYLIDQKNRPTDPGLRKRDTALLANVVFKI